MKPILFFDDGGVLNDNEIRGEQWKPLIADWFGERYGGERDLWMKANYEAVMSIMNVIYEGMDKTKKCLIRIFKKLKIQFG